MILNVSSTPALQTVALCTVQSLCDAPMTGVIFMVASIAVTFWEKHNVKQSSFNDNCPMNTSSLDRNSYTKPLRTRLKAPFSQNRSGNTSERNPPDITENHPIAQFNSLDVQLQQRILTYLTLKEVAQLANTSRKLANTVRAHTSALVHRSSGVEQESTSETRAIVELASSLGMASGATTSIEQALPITRRVRSIDLSQRRYSLGKVITLTGKYSDLISLSLDGSTLQGNCGFVQNLPQLHSLALKTVSACTLSSLLAQPTLSQLNSLTLTKSRINHGGARAIAKCRHFMQLKKLNLGENLLGSAGIALIVSSIYLTNLQALHVHKNAIGSDGVRHIAQSPFLSKIRVLNLADNQIGYYGVCSLTSFPILHELRKLDLSCNKIGNAGARELARAIWLQKIKVLKLENAHIGSLGKRVLKNSENFTNTRIQYRSLSLCSIDSEYLKF